MAKIIRTRKKPRKSEQNFSTALAAITFSLVLIYFIQSAMAIIKKHPIDTAIARYEQQVQLESNDKGDN
ncbi:hypothetical protein L4D76_20450 [Photobacterium sagamiensis]|uniref:hypothetical protein n=1 Tax=Photobacterium sagamiensis TaxID=2910241 RepID=UPI003D0BBC6C